MVSFPRRRRGATSPAKDPQIAHARSRFHTGGAISGNLVCCGVQAPLTTTSPQPPPRLPLPPKLSENLISFAVFQKPGLGKWGRGKSNPHLCRSSQKKRKTSRGTDRGPVRVPLEWGRTIAVLSSPPPGRARLMAIGEDRGRTERKPDVFPSASHSAAPAWRSRRKRWQRRERRGCRACRAGRHTVSWTTLKTAELCDLIYIYGLARIM